VYAVGDKLAKLHGIKNDNGGFYNLGLDTTKLEPVVAAEEPPVILPVVIGEEPQPVAAEEQAVVAEEPLKVEILSPLNVESAPFFLKKESDAVLLLKVLNCTANKIGQLLPA
jgi:hypothetical protein